MKMIKRVLAILLTLSLMFSFVACGKPAAELSLSDKEPNADNVSTKLPTQDKLSREDKELVVELMGDGEDAKDLPDNELNDLVHNILDKTDKKDDPSLDSFEENKGAYNENGEMTKPFDQVYPELIEEEKVAFSGESILIKLKKNTLTDGLKAAGIGALELIVPMENAAWYEAKLIEGADAKAALAAVRELQEVLLAEFNYEIQTAALDDYKHFDKEKDEEFKKNGHNKDQWHFHYCGIPDGYEEMEIDGGDSSVIVAVIDSGVDYEHEDLKDNIWVNTGEIPDNNIDDDKNGYVDDYYGVDIIARKGNGGDTNGHGTHVAGIIAARNNNVGVLGIAYNVKIMSVKAAMHNGTLNQADIARAVLYAYEMGAEIINMSFGGSACSIAVQDALATAYTRCVLVASAGNSGMPNEPTDFYPNPLPNYPAALTYVLGVMSVDETGTESVFTNWDAFPFNGVEYEVYAPGENIMSTLPGNKYGYLSGTSMAAPVVSAFAAILRSEFTDRDKYPTKFIYGQLASTSGIYADCCDPERHTIGGVPHNLPQIVNLYDALTKLPKPELNVQEYHIFDDPKYSDKNNGDGVIDAGETIALGLVLRNRWGMSENTLVTIDTISKASGLADPYFTIKNPTVDYGSVGTYSTQDCGKVYTDELFTGWENPFLIEVSEDCPNDYRFTLNITITCENALDEEDDTLYVFGEHPHPITLNENVRSGHILPSVIEEDMVLTKDNLYIIPNATIIAEGVTVRVEPGTHIQFWSDDADDPYADSYIAYLLVNGKLLVEGTKEEPVYIYPSQLMDQYGVEIGSSGAGYVSLKYADITNFFYPTYLGCDHTGTGNHIDLADHCTFRNNYSGTFRYRELSGGKVRDVSGNSGTIGHINARDCVFYKLVVSAANHLYGSYDRCVFTQCGIDFEGTHNGCVFLGNTFAGVASSLLAKNSIGIESPGRFTVYYRPETGTTYLRYYSCCNEAEARYIREAFGGSWLVAETLEEYEWVTKNITAYVDCGIQQTADGFTWSDGTPLQSAFVAKKPSHFSSSSQWCLENYAVVYGSSSNVKAVFEIPGQILPTDITFQEYAVDMDLEATYQLAPLSAPVQLPLDGFLYESMDESVIRVSATGLVTPVGKGTADVWVYSLDKAVKNRVTITVRDYVPLESITFPAASAEVAVGETLALRPVLTPGDTTRNNVVYTTSDPTVATVDASGNITGLSSGTAVITATCEGLADTFAVTVYNKTTNLRITAPVIMATIDNQVAQLPSVSISESASADIRWDVMDPSVATIKDGAVHLRNPGMTTLIATDVLTGLSDEVILYVSESTVPKVSEVRVDNGYAAALLEDGRLYQIDRYSTETARLVFENVAKMDISGSYVLALFDDNTIRSNGSATVIGFPFEDKKLVDIAGYYYTSDYGAIFALDENGHVYAKGGRDANVYGGLGVGAIDQKINDFTQVLINEAVKQVEWGGKISYFLAESGNLYISGGHYCKWATPKLVARNVTYLQEGGDYYVSDGKVYSFLFTSTQPELMDIDVSAVDLCSVTDNAIMAIKNGRAYAWENGNWVETLVGLENVSLLKAGTVSSDGISIAYDTIFAVTENGCMFASGANVGMHTETSFATDEFVFAPLVSIDETLSIISNNLNEGNVLQSQHLELTFNKQLLKAECIITENGTEMLQECTINGNVLRITLPLGWVPGAEYRVMILADNAMGLAYCKPMQDIEIAFTYTPGEETTPEETIPEEKVVYEAILDPSVERILTAERVAQELAAFLEKTQYSPDFTGNAILNPISTDFEVSHWLRPTAPTVTVGTYSEIPLGGNWWGSVNETAIGLQMVDYTDFPNYARLMYAPFLTEAPENTFPFVTSVTLWNKDGEQVTTVGNEQVTFRVTFNRDMDTSIPLLVRFGSAFPYGDYEIEGRYVDARTWEGVYTLNTLIENGNQYFTISNGCSATDDLPLQLDQYRFGFVIDTTAAQALIMQGAALDTGIELKWTQDDFKTLMGYNVYRSTNEDGLYTRLNSTVIPADTMEWVDTTVEPGVVYYYNFTIVQTDLTESEPSGKIVIMSKDTMAPNIYHSPVAGAFTGSNLVVSATITDNLNIAYANLYYRVTGTEEWTTIRMNKLNDKFSAIIPAGAVTLEGIEYYIEAFDGISFTYKGTAETPFTIAVQEAVDANALGDVDGDGVITNLDALLLLYAINDKYNLTAEEFARADLNGDGKLWAAEALRILQYVSGVVGSVKM